MCFPIEKAVEKKWEFEGLQCIVTRADIGHAERRSKHRCGYVRVPPKHSWHGMDYNDIPADVHGGLTFAEIEPCTHDDGTGYWIGFDCIHYGDRRFPANYVPDAKSEGERLLFSMDTDGHYWTLDEVVAETERLARQVLAQ